MCLSTSIIHRPLSIKLLKNLRNANLQVTDSINISLTFKQRVVHQKGVMKMSEVIGELSEILHGKYDINILHCENVANLLDT